MILENVYYEKKHSYVRRSCSIFTFYRSEKLTSPLSKQLYDLKGSTRNRWVTPTNKVGQVLLDANLESSTSLSRTMSFAF
jgi:hypothetical protein